MIVYGPKTQWRIGHQNKLTKQKKPVKEIAEADCDYEKRLLQWDDLYNASVEELEIRNYRARLEFRILGKLEIEPVSTLINQNKVELFIPLENAGNNQLKGMKNKKKVNDKIGFFYQKSEYYKPKNVAQEAKSFLINDKWNLKMLYGDRYILFSIEGKLFIFDRSATHSSKEHVYLFTNQDHIKTEFHLSLFSKEYIKNVTKNFNERSIRRFDKLSGNNYLEEEQYSSIFT